MSFALFTLVALVMGAFVFLSYLVGSKAGVLSTPRALLVAGGLALLGVLGFWIPGMLDLMLVLDVLLLLLIWLDAEVGGSRKVTVSREPLPALSVGHTGQVTYRWINASPRPARLRVREVRPDLLGATQPARAFVVPARGSIREELPVSALRRGRETAGAFVIDSVGPLGLGRRRYSVQLPWDVIVYPPMVSMRSARYSAGPTPLSATAPAM